MVSCKETKVTEVRLNKTELSLKVNETETLIATVLPEKADNKDVIWNSNTTTVATVDNGTITAKLAGTAIITVTTLEGNKTANCTVIVTENVIPIEEPEMVFVEGGTFWYGCTDDECDYSDTLIGRYPPVQTTVGSFYISKYLVTQKLWKDVMGTLPQSTLSWSYGEGDNYPVYYVDIYRAFEFLRKLNSVTGKNYKLPSSVEWEYAARGGNKSKGYKYSGSNNIDEVAWYYNNSNRTTHLVGTKAPNELGVYDMSGNLWEWTRDEGPFMKSTANVVRGGSWYYGDCRVSSYAGQVDINRGYYLGFRLVLYE